MHIRISLCIKCKFEQTILNFSTKFAQEITVIELRIFKLLVLVPDFSLNWQNWFCWPDLPKKSVLGLRKKMWTHIFNIILYIQISLLRNFSWNCQFWFFGPNLPKKVFPVKNRKSEHHRILQIWLSLGDKFQLKLIVLGFWTKFAQKRYFQSETKQLVQGNSHLLFV